ncbi:L-alanine-DL-glutamate epimerase [Natronoarchaeum philippinense]|uniref:L-alanine-DL-glutamate epimerase n=1 Tax=Natronoarchaeum philippinense TaxID=558529 RepID=A0A285NYF5_NATPI|nr:hypothetical protein [Natronoarchaeum philippinense]SNZ12671.1 L-alanine-DL-glutamate epimerase [Natronoarchaeum philippinense]
MALYDAVADLDLVVDDWELSLRERDTSSGFVRTTTVFELRGDGAVGRGEDVTYEESHHHALVEDEPDFELAGEYAFDEFSQAVGNLDLFPAGAPDRDVFRNYRRWGVESAALDLALRQADLSLADALDESYDPVRFVASTRLGDPPTLDRIDALREVDADMEFKLDPTPDWTPEIIEELAETDAVRILDLKGQYEGTEVDVAADPELYERLIDAFDETVIEDPDLTDETRPIVDDAADRVSWDAPIHGIEDVEALPWEPDWLNIKPSRFGSVRSLFETIEYAAERDVELYGGGQFELGVGRQHIQLLASLFYPDGPNDVAPRAYNDPELGDDLPTSPLAPPDDALGLSWREDV